MGWRIDIKSEEEKRQEVETAMSAMVGAGTPVSILIEHGLGDKMVDKLLESDISTVERLADMTPEQLEEIPGIGPKMVEKIQVAVNSYYLQFEPQQVPAEEVVPADEDETGEAPVVVLPAVMPGLPVEGEDTDDSETENGEEDFDNMDLSAEDEADEVESDEFGDEDVAADSAAAAAVSEVAGAKGPLDAGVRKTTIEDDDMTN
jgi:N utilization substance protein A